MYRWVMSGLKREESLPVCLSRDENILTFIKSGELGYSQLNRYGPAQEPKSQGVQDLFLGIGVLS